MSSCDRLQGRKILITGAASGIGLATARLFLHEQAEVALLDKDIDGLNALKAELGERAHIFRVDLTDREEVEKAVAAAAKALGGLDGLVNVAGISLRKSFESTTFDEWNQVMAVNLNAAFLVCKAGLPFLQEAGKSTIVNVSSGAGLRPLNDFSAYCASKAGLVLFSKALAIDLESDGIRVNAVCPGVVNTPMIERSLARAPDREAARAAHLRNRVMKRLGEPEEIAFSILFLTSDEASFVTGSAFAIDGGTAFH